MSKVLEQSIEFLAAAQLPATTQHAHTPRGTHNLFLAFFFFHPGGEAAGHTPWGIYNMIGPHS